MNANELDRFRRMEAIFDAAADSRAGAEREALLSEECANDADLLVEVRQMLDDHDRVREAAPLGTHAASESLPEFGAQFGAWKAVRLLGRGGMGTVYLAERADGAFRMPAAVKVVPLALASLDIEERFRRERQFLASLDHPKVARLIDGGVTSSGLPYLVMEYVDGHTIEKYCEVHELDTRGRIELFRQVLQAMAYVHSRGVIHRDLKPSNILVDGSGSAKVLDFGLARVMDASGDASITKTGVFAFTPECASPEQVAGKEITFASDTYSLGVLLYRLLAGRPPYRFTDYSPQAIAERINQTEPEPSGLEEPLESILSKALDRDPAARYATAAEMDADLAAYLSGQPVSIKRPAKASKMAIALAAILLCMGIGWLLFKPRTVEASIAVLPFSNVSANGDGQYLSSGLSDELSEALAGVKSLRVLAPASVAKFKGATVDFRQAGRELQVENVLEGTVDRAGDRVKIVARLERVSDGALLWSETYDRSVPELIAFESELAAKVARALKASPALAAKHVPPAEAHDSVLKARYELQRMTTDSLKLAKADYQHAMDLDPEYAEAYYGLGSAEYDEMVARGSLYQTDAERKSAQALLEKAISLNPDLGGARALLAVMAMQYEWDWRRAEAEFRRSSSGTPNATAEFFYAYLLLCRGRFQEVDEHVRRVQDLDPFSTQTMNNIGLVRMVEGRYGEAREYGQRMLMVAPDMLAGKMITAMADAGAGNRDLAMKELEEWKKHFPPAQMFEAMTEAKAGHREEALRLVRPFEEKYPNAGVPMQWFALVYALLGDEAESVKWLERSADRHEFQALNLGVNPLFARVRNSTGFRALEKRIGLIE